MLEAWDPTARFVVARLSVDLRGWENIEVEVTVAVYDIRPAR